MRLDHLSQSGRSVNNFDLLRLVAASLVIFAHSFNLLELPEPLLSVAPAGWGYIAILIFFSISGFLVARSWANSPHLVPFAVKRALRILPALVVVLVLSALVLGPLVTTEASHAYLVNPATKAYIINNTMMQTDYQLPGVFAHNAYPVAVNGSLWSLPLEVKAYVLVALLGIAGLLSRRRTLMIGVAVLSILVCIDTLRPSIPGASHFVASLVDIQANPELVNEARLGGDNLYAELFAAFTVGAMLFALRRWIVVRWELCLCALVAWVIVTIVVHNPTLEVSTVILGPYIVICLAYCTVRFVRLPRLFGDYSYGMYIYGFPVQQTLSYLLIPTSGWVLFLISMPVTLVFAVASWHFVERPALNIKRRLTTREPSPVAVGLSPAFPTVSAPAE